MKLPLKIVLGLHWLFYHKTVIQAVTQTVTFVIENCKFSFSSVSLLLEALEERDPEIVYNAAVTLANIAMYDGNHSLLINSDAVESLKKFVPHDSR